MEFGYLLSHLVTQLPVVLVLIVGVTLVAVQRNRLPARPAAFAIAGCIALLVGMVVSAVWSALLPSLIRESSVASIGVVSSAFGLLQALIHAAGLALLVVAVLTSRTPAPAS